MNFLTWQFIILFIIGIIIIFGLIFLRPKNKHHSSKNGLQKIWSSAKGMLVMISLFICTFLAITNKMTPSFAAAIGSLVSVMLVVHSKNDRTSMNVVNPVLSNPTGNSTPGLMGNPPPITQMLIEENKKDTP